MKNKGFTLVELLAVIVILAIIALIAVPIILGIISDSKNESAERSAELYIDAANKAIARYQMSNSNVNFSGTKNCSITSVGIACPGMDTIKVEIDGQAPSGGTIVLVNGKVSSGTTITYGTSSQAKTYTYDGTRIVLEGSSNNTSEDICETFATKSFGSSCTYEDLDSSNSLSVGDKVTCGTEGFYVIEDPSNNRVKMLAEWNLNVTDPDADSYQGISMSQLYDCSTEGYQDLHVRGILDEDVGRNIPYMKQVTFTFGGSGSGSYSSSGSYSYSGSGGRTRIVYLPYGTLAFWNRVAVKNYNYSRGYGYWTNNTSDSLNNAFTECTGDNCVNYYGVKYPIYVYGINNSNNDATSTITPFVNQYVQKFNSQISGASVTGRLISYEELSSLGCNKSQESCHSAPSWVYQTSYWSGSARSAYGTSIYVVNSYGDFFGYNMDSDYTFGIRPVIEINTSVISAG